MDLVYSGDKYKNLKKSIFLAGPTPRDKNVSSWRNKAIEIFKKYNFDGTLIIPERLGKPYYEKENNYEEIKWDLKALEEAKVVMMWIPRNPDMLGLSSNVEFGYLLNKGNIVYGRPEKAFRCELLDYLYKEKLNRDYSKSLEELVKEAIDFLNRSCSNEKIW